MNEVRVLFVDKAAAAGDPEARTMLFPAPHSAGAAGRDLVAANEEPLVIEPGRRALVPTGVALAISPGFEGQVRPRSGLALKHGITCLNAPGTIDADYRGEIKVILQNHGEEPFSVRRGMRVAQLVIAAVANLPWSQVDTLDETDRSQKGFGSTG